MVKILSASDSCCKIAARGANVDSYNWVLRFSDGWQSEMEQRVLRFSKAGESLVQVKAIMPLRDALILPHLRKWRHDTCWVIGFQRPH